MARNLDIEIDPAELGDTTLYPPRRTLVDFLPDFIKNPLRVRFNVLPATPREVWVLKSLFLRIFYNTYRVSELIEKQPKAFHTGELKAPDKGKEYEPEGGWN
jgi:hypothetical protein